MRKRRLLIGIGLLMAVFAIAAVACDEEDEGEATPTEPAATEPAATEPSETPTTEEAAGTPANGARIIQELTASLQPVAGSTVEGSATLRPVAEGTEVAVEVTGGLTPGGHANHLHHGTCDALGEFDVTLEELTAGADGSATATTIIPEPAEETPTPGAPGAGTPEALAFIHFMQIDHVLAVHEGPTDVPRPIVACGPVETQLAE